MEQRVIRLKGVKTSIVERMVVLQSCVLIYYLVIKLLFGWLFGPVRAESLDLMVQVGTVILFNIVLYITYKTLSEEVQLGLLKEINQAMKE